MEALVRAHERIDDLELNGLSVIQNPSAFCFGMDAVLLADFMQVRPGETIVDMGTGTGILPILLSQKQETTKFHAIELQEEMADMAERTMRLNRLEQRIQVHHVDMRHAHTLLGREVADAVVCNPPYGKRGGTLPSETKSHLLARHETDMSIAEVVAACAAVMKNHGRLAMVFPAARMLELCDALREKRVEPKRVRLVYAKADRAPYLVLIEAMKNAKPALKWLPPLIVYHEDGTETAELKRIYHKDQEGLI